MSPEKRKEITYLSGTFSSRRSRKKKKYTNTDREKYNKSSLSTDFKDLEMKQIKIFIKSKI